VHGSVEQRGDRMEIAASLRRMRPRLPDARAARAHVVGPTDSLVVLLDRLSDQLVGQRSGGFIHSAVLGTRSLEAMRWYLEGEAALRSGRQEQAARALQQAVAHDSTFAMAYLRLSTAALWSAGDLSRRASDRAVQLSSGLPPGDSLLILAWNRHHLGLVDEAEQLYEQLLRRRPDDVDAWYQLAELLYHWGPSLGRPATLARSAFERAVHLDPGHAPARIHLLRLAALEGRMEALDTLTRRALQGEPAERTALELRALRAFSIDEPQGRAEILRELAALSDDELHPIVRTVMPTLADPTRALDLVLLLSDPVRSAELRLNGRVLEAQLRAAAGRPAEGRALLATGPSEHLEWEVEYRAALAFLPFARAPRGELEQLRSTIATLSRRPAHGHLRLLTTWTWVMYPPQQEFLLGMLDQALGDEASALMRADRLSAVRGMGSAEYARTLRAYVLYGRGAHAEALRALGSPEMEDPRFPKPFSYPRAYNRWLRAELLNHLGRHEEALRWFETFPDPSVYDLMFLPAAHVRRGQILERSRDAGAAAAYLLALEIWSDPEPALAPLVEVARRGARRARVERHPETLPAALR
jgi:tetratricopeptide (TPR) repeat protein